MKWQPRWSWPRGSLGRPGAPINQVVSAERATRTSDRIRYRRLALRVLPLLLGAGLLASLSSPVSLPAPSPRAATASLVPPEGLPRPAPVPLDTSAFVAARALAGSPGERASAATGGPTTAPGSEGSPVTRPAAANDAAGAVLASQAGSATSWTYLSDLPWEQATSGLLGLADRNEPMRDQAFPRLTPLVVAGQPYEKGLGTLPFSEIEYALPADAVAFRARLAINDLPLMA